MTSVYRIKRLIPFILSGIRSVPAIFPAQTALPNSLTFRDCAWTSAWHDIEVTINQSIDRSIDSVVLHCFCIFTFPFNLAWNMGYVIQSSYFRICLTVGLLHLKRRQISWLKKRILDHNGRRQRHHRKWRTGEESPLGRAEGSHSRYCKGSVQSSTHGPRRSSCCYRAHGLRKIDTGSWRSSPKRGSHCPRRRIWMGKVFAFALFGYVFQFLISQFLKNVWLNCMLTGCRFFGLHDPHHYRRYGEKHRSSDGLIDWLAGWLVDALIDWLIDWLIEFHRVYPTVVWQTSNLVSMLSVLGMTYSFGVLLPDLLEKFKGSKSATSLIMSVLIGTTYGSGTFNFLSVSWHSLLLTF